MDEDNEPIIMDIGTAYLKVGFANDDNPKHYIPMLVGIPKAPGIMVGMDEKKAYFGEEVLHKTKKPNLNISYPVQEGLVVEPDLLQDLMDDVFQQTMGISPDEYKVMLTEPPNNPKENREKLVEMMFEKFEVPRLYLGNQSVLSLFATGKTTGTVLDSGEGVTHAVPIYEGYAIPHAIQTINLSGNDLTNFMHQLLLEKHPQHIQDTSEFLTIAKQAKEKECMVAQDYDAEFKQATEHSTIETKYDLPGDKHIILKEERIKCPELLFNPQFAGKDIDGIHKFTHDCIIKCDNDIRKDLFKNIVLAGGCTMFQGMKDRMKKEIQALAPSPMGPEVEAPADRKYSCWLGGAILSLIEKFENMWIKKSEFEEQGAKVVHRKCF